MGLTLNEQKTRVCARRRAAAAPGALGDGDAVLSARTAGLRHVRAGGPGLRRVRRGPRVRYVDPAGRPVREPRTLARIRRLAIPPAWTDVWICTRADGHVQAVGRDARGRKQYRYHPRWRTVRDATKYGRLAAFAEALPGIRARVARDLARPGLPRRKVLATVVRLLEITALRVGNAEYARRNGSFGLTTLRDAHVRVRGPRVRLEFRGKSGKLQRVDLHDPRLARVVRRCRELPGQELFRYLDDRGRVRGVGSADVNAYLREIAGADFTAKDFRTWTGTVLAARELGATAGHLEGARTPREVARAIERVAAQLGNTAAVCRKAYVHPLVIETYLAGRPLELPHGSARRWPASGRRGLSAEEAAVLRVLRPGALAPPAARRGVTADATRRPVADGPVSARRAA